MSYIKVIANGLNASVTVPVVNDVISRMPDGNYLKIAFTHVTQNVDGIILTDENGNVLINENDSQLTGTT
jgi:hypothetical protein